MSGTNVRYNIFLFRIHYWLSAYDIYTIAAYLYDFFELKVLYYELKMEKLSVINIVMPVVKIPQRIKSTFFCFFCNCFEEKKFPTITKIILFSYFGLLWILPQGTISFKNFQSLLLQASKCPTNKNMICSLAR